GRAFRSRISLRQKTALSVAKRGTSFDDSDKKINIRVNLFLVWAAKPPKPKKGFPLQLLTQLGFSN
ncbi:hypothetical protein, partial [Kaistella carnis]|uniref:hypothetical protein n=1 Tax=Kaistella carnis TaxID=1241979 RepID=UPI0028ADC0F1